MEGSRTARPVEMFDQATRTCEDIQLVSLDVAFNEFEIGDLEVIQLRESNLHFLVAALFTLEAIASSRHKSGVVVETFGKRKSAGDSRERRYGEQGAAPPSS